ncbi:MAG: FAD-dependent monooxygenase [Solibacillus sp.]
MQASRENPIIVVGGGIGGLTAALALANKGQYVKVLEQAPEFLEVGAGIQIAANASRVLGELGVLERLKNLAVFPKRLVMMDAFTGKELSALDLGPIYQERYGAPYFVLHRADLQNALYEVAKDDSHIELLTNQQIVDSLQDEQGVRVTNQNFEVHQGSAVIAADGIWSKQRSKIVKDNVICSQYVAYRGTIEMSEMGDSINMDDVYMWIGPNLHLVQYPVRKGELYNQVVVFKSFKYRPEIEQTDEWGTPEEMDQVFAGSCDQVQHAISFISRQRRWPMYDREPISNWTDGKLTLLGDAAHPMLQYIAQGGCQAIEDATFLAEMVAQHDTIEEAYENYQQVRIPHTAMIQRNARMFGEIIHANAPETILLRDTILNQRSAQDFDFIDPVHGFHAKIGQPYRRQKIKV